MMNIQNPSFAQHQHAHGYGHPQSMTNQRDLMAQFGSDQNQFAQFPNTPQRPSQLNPQLQNQIPPRLYQQLQQQQQQQQAAGFVRPQSRDSFGIGQGQHARQSRANLQQHSQSIGSLENAPGTPAQRQQTHNMNMSMTPNMGMNIAAVPNMQQSPAVPQPRNPQPQAAVQMNSQAVAREEERVSTLLEINSHLIQEVTNLQAQGKAGNQPVPASPTADNANAMSNSPSDPAKKGQTSQEYADCMRRLQANLAYLAAIADASKKASGQRPVGPAIMIPPTHLVSVHPLYQKLRNLFPEASQSTLNKAMAVANAQAARAAAGQQAPSQMAG